MNVFIYSREEIESIISEGKFPENTAVVSFFDPATKRIDPRLYSHRLQRCLRLRFLQRA